MECTYFLCLPKRFQNQRINHDHLVFDVFSRIFVVQRHYFQRTTFLVGSIESWEYWVISLSIALNELIHISDLYFLYHEHTISIYIKNHFWKKKYIILISWNLLLWQIIKSLWKCTLECVGNKLLQFRDL